MARELRARASRQSCSEQVAAKAAEIRLRYGPEIGWPELQQLLKDRDCVPFPCEVRFDAAPLLPGEFAHSLPSGSSPQEGYIIYVHPAFASQLSSVPYLVLHQLVMVSFGDSAGADDAETFGSLALGLSKEAYYQALCELSGQLGGDELL